MNGREALALAAGGARRALMVKLGVPVAALFMAFLVLLGAFAGIGGGASSAAACGKPGQPADDGANGRGGDETGGAGKELRKRQVENAKIIDQVAKDGKLPGRATLIALMTALAESELDNINYGDRDSLGLFQQQWSTGWGTKEQIMDPKYAAHMFFFGGDSGDPPGLTSYSWEGMSLNDAAQKVQRSGFPDAYGPKETQARSIAKEAGIDLERAGDNHPGRPGQSGNKPAQDGHPKPDGGPGNCNTTGNGNGTPAAPGEPFHDGASGWPAKVVNRRSTDDAIAWAKAEAASHRADWYQKCLAFTSIAYGWNFSGTDYAIDHYTQIMPKDMRHDGDRNPPKGALMFWDTGHRAGHVAIYVGDGNIASNDIEGKGEIAIVPATAIETKWGAKYLGWSPPYYPNAG